MFQLDDSFLADLGLGNMSTDDKKAFNEHLYRELELRVGTELSKDLSDQQLKDFKKVIEKKDQQQALQWLEGNCPNYKAVVAAELEKLRQEVIANREEILGPAA